MIQSHISIVIFVIWCHCVELSSVQNGNKPALIIDRLTGSIIDLPSSISTKSECGSWANACPAQNVANEEFVAKNALHENSLFMKQICTENKTLEEAEFGIEICSKYFKISVAFNKMNLTFDFGYEVYVPEENKHLFTNLIAQKNYVSVKKALDPIETDSMIQKFTNEILHFVYGENFPHDGRKMIFMWISLFEVEFDFQQLTPIKIFYQVRNNNRWPVSLDTSCKEDKLTDEVFRKFTKTGYQKIDIKLMYSDLPQRMTFSLHVLPDEGCRDELICLNQWSIIPIDQFHFGGLNSIQCSHMATVPIWTSTLKFPLIKVDKFIYALFQVLGPSLHVVAGIWGQLRLKLKQPENNYPIVKDESNIYVDMMDEKVPVPEIIYKVIKYKSDHCPEDDLCWYSATIIIHNNPFFDPINKICSDVTAKWGWTEVNLYVADLPGNATEKRYQSKYIYVCKSEPELLNLLMGSSAEKQPQKMRDFNLAELFPKETKENVHDEFIEREIFEKLLILTEIQSKSFENEQDRELAEKELDLMRKENHLSIIEEIDEGNISEDDNEGNTVKPIQFTKDDNVGRINKGMEENAVDKI